VTLADKLNKYGVSFSLTKTGVELNHRLITDEDNSLDTEGSVTDQAFSSFLDVLDASTSYVDYDPRDSKAGLVVYVEAEGARAWLRVDLSGECSWVEDA